VNLPSRLWWIACDAVYSLVWVAMWQVACDTARMSRMARPNNCLALH
jgi:hypothetical protein